MSVHYALWCPKPNPKGQRGGATRTGNACHAQACDLCRTDALGVLAVLRALPLGLLLGVGVLLGLALSLVLSLSQN
jgi:hypothetical protein